MWTLMSADDPAFRLFSCLVTLSLVKVTALAWIRKKKLRKFECVGRVHALYNYPIKGCSVVECTDADAEALGLRVHGLLDRHWMIVKNMSMINMKMNPRFVLVKVTPLGQGDLRLDAPGMPSLILYMDRCKRIVICRIYGINMDVIDCGDEAATWLNTFMEYDDLRLVYSPPHLTKRDASDVRFSWQNNTKEGDLTAFSYLTSYLFTSASSLHDLNQRLESPVSMINFRPNIVILGTPPFDEDHWLEVRIGEHVLFRIADVCRRCPITTIDPFTGTSSQNKQPLAKLKSYRTIPPYGTAPLFGVYCALEVPGRVKVGDNVYVIRGERKTHQSLLI